MTALAQDVSKLSSCTANSTSPTCTYETIRVANKYLCINDYVHSSCLTSQGANEEEQCIGIPPSGYGQQCDNDAYQNCIVDLPLPQGNACGADYMYGLMTCAVQSNCNSKDVHQQCVSGSPPTKDGCDIVDTCKLYVPSDMPPYSPTPTPGPGGLNCDESAMTSCVNNLVMQNVCQSEDTMGECFYEAVASCYVGTNCYTQDNFDGCRTATAQNNISNVICSGINIYGATPTPTPTPSTGPTPSISVLQK